MKSAPSNSDYADRHNEVVFIDLDSTLADTSARHHLVNEEDWDATDWIAYSMACESDVPFVGAKVLCNLLYKAGYHVVIVSGRADKAVGLTEAWLEGHGIEYDELLLKDPAFEHMSNERYKARRVHAWLRENPLKQARLLIDDWPEVAAEMEKQHIPVLVTNPCYDEAKAAVL